MHFQLTCNNNATHYAKHTIAKDDKQREGERQLTVTEEAHLTMDWAHLKINDSIEWNDFKKMTFKKLQ